MVFWDMQPIFGQNHIGTDSTDIQKMGVPRCLRLLVDLHRFLATNRECQKMRRRLRPIYQSYDTSKLLVNDWKAGQNMAAEKSQTAISLHEKELEMVRGKSDSNPTAPALQDKIGQC